MADDATARQQLIDTMEGLRAGRLSREAVQKEAAAACVNGHSPYTGVLYDAHQALVALDVRLPEWLPARPSPWVIDDTAMADWVAVLRGQPRTTRDADGWTVTTREEARLGMRGLIVGDFDEHTPGTLQRTFGPPLRSRDLDFGTWEQWLLTTPDGTRLSLVRHVGYERAGAEPYGHFEVRLASEHALRDINQRCVDMMYTLDKRIDVSAQRAYRLRDGVSLKHPFALWRMDDNGNAFRVSRHPTEAGAQRAMAWLTRRRHKQTYWIEGGD